MNYELAKKLKDAGWPQNLDCIHGMVLNGIQSDEKPQHWWGKREWAVIPTLSELIEACIKLSQDGDFHLEAMHGRWGASTCWKHKKDEWENGDTPEEAVANLWLELNKK